jgi:hypothetical protein
MKPHTKKHESKESMKTKMKEMANEKKAGSKKKC